MTFMSKRALHSPGFSSICRTDFIELHSQYVNSLKYCVNSIDLAFGGGMHKKIMEQLTLIDAFLHDN